MGYKKTGLLHSQNAIRLPASRQVMRLVFGSVPIPFI